MPTYIYTRVSTDKQETSNQLPEMLRRYPESRIIEETASGAKNRPELEKLLAELHEGDTLVVYALDRLGRRCGELVTLLDDLSRRKVTLVSLREGLDLSTMGGRFIGQIFAALAELERSMISERTKSALHAKKEAGVQLGRPRTISEEAEEKIRSLAKEGKTCREIATEVGVSFSTVSRYLRRKEGEPANEASSGVCEGEGQERLCGSGNPSPRLFFLT